MDESTSHRLSGLSKRQLLAAIEAMAEKCGDAAVTVLTSYLESIPPPPGSSKAVSVKSGGDEGAGRDKKEVAGGVDKSFSFDKYRTRQIALQVQYDGTAYLGFASQDLEATIENHLFCALTKLKLIQDRKTCNYSRCGRTDKGVSALGQVISLNVRSAIPKDLPEHLLQRLVFPTDSVVIENPAATAGSADTGTETTTAGGKSGKKNKNKAAAAVPTHKTITEMDYVTMLNRSLPDDIRVLGWCAVTPEFSARFSASHRMYRYFFLHGTLDIQAMQAAAKLLVGDHDFRNICKIDIGNVTNFRREIYSAEIKLFQQGCGDSVVDGVGTDVSVDGSEHPNAVYMLEIKGIAFLWHMVRCIMSLLFMVGRRQEQPCVVSQLLEVSVCQGKPPYTMAPEDALVLHECGFDNLHIRMQARHLWQLTAHYRSILEGHLISAARVRNSLELVLNSAVGRTEADEFICSLLCKQEVHSQRLADRCGVTVVGNAINNGSADVPVGGSKRKLAEILPKEGADESAAIEAVGVVGWAELLRQMEGEHGLVPVVKYIPHVPLMQRKREDTYEEKVSNLAGNKKERLERHVTLSAAAAESGATPSFFQKMRQQGSL